MWTCAQLDANGVCRTVARLAGPVDGERIVPLEDGIPDVLGQKYASGRFYGLVASAQTPSVPVGQTTVIDIRWVDLTGAVVDDPDPVTAVCNGIQTAVAMAAGQGTVEFQADAAGTYTIIVAAACGVTTSLEVTVS